jgi:MFS family permease
MRTSPAIFLLCWLVGLVCGFVATSVPVYLPVIVQDLTGSAAPEAVGRLGAILQSLFLAGWISGGIVIGIAADRVGRTRTLIAALVITAAACAATWIADSVSLLAITRLIAGIGVGAMMVLNITIGAEQLSHLHRPWLMGVLANAYAVGIISAGAVQAAVPEWRWTIGAIAISVVLAFLLLPFRSRIDAVHEPSHGSAARPATTLREHRSTLVMASLLFGSMLIVLWAAFTWMPSWATSLHPGDDGGAALRGRIMAALGMGGIVGSLFSGPLAIRFGRVRTLILCYIGAVIPSCALYLMPSPEASTMIIMTACMALFFGMSQGLMALYIPELFPTSIRAGSVGIVFNAGRVLTALAVVNIGVIVAWTGGYREALLLFTFPLLIGLVFSFRAPEPDPATITSHS